MVYGTPIEREKREVAMQARWWKREDKTTEKAARCFLCVHNCLIEQGKSGYCAARIFDGEHLVSPWLGQFSSIAVDPVEKKPLYHFRPGTHILSLGSLGCTMRCPFCQNHTIAQPHAVSSGAAPRLTPIAPEHLVAEALGRRLDSVAYTYNEPALQAEYIIAAAPLLHDAGIATVLVSNGMYSDELLDELAPWVDAANIDIKCFNPNTYTKLGGSLERAQNAVTRLLNAGAHVEVTTLVVPGVSDSLEEFALELEWLASLSPRIPLHISRYRPAHKFSAPPTDIALLKRFAAAAKEKLHHVHIGNVPGMV